LDRQIHGKQERRLYKIMKGNGAKNGTGITGAVVDRRRNFQRKKNPFNRMWRN